MLKLKKLLVFSLLIAFSSSCEIDDICTEEILTPRLKIKFYDADNPDNTKTITELYVWAEGKDSLYVNKTADSIYLPLDAINITTKYLMSVASVVDTLELAYDTYPVFVSRSCGYIHNFTISTVPNFTNHWIQNLNLVNIPQNIENETDTAIKVYH